MNRVNEIIRLKGLVDRIIPVGIGSGVSAAYVEAMISSFKETRNCFQLIFLGEQY